MRTPTLSAARLAHRSRSGGFSLTELAVTIAIATFAFVPLTMVFINVADAQNEADAIMEVRRDIDLVDISIRERLINAVDIYAPTNDGTAISFTTTATFGTSSIVYDKDNERLLVDGKPINVRMTRFRVVRESPTLVRLAYSVQFDDVTLTTETVYASVNGIGVG